MKRLGSAPGVVAGALLAVLCACPAGAQGPAPAWPAASPPIIKGSAGYVEIPGVAVRRDPARTYKALFDATRAPADPTKPVEAVARVALQINGLLGAHVPPEHIRFALILHKGATDAVLTSTAYRRKYKIDNPNIPLIDQLTRVGVRFLVCGQYLAHADIPRSDLITQAEVAESATLVVISFADDGYAVLTE